jgi:valyl-tRNA synthetase
MAELEKHYDPKDIEKKWYEQWEKSGDFKPNGQGKPYVIVIPPPNITAKLHMGHGLNLTLQDISIRFQRMMGRDTLWLPGEDHAGIATQNVVEKNLKEEGKTKDDLGREQFIEKTWKWADEYRGHIRDQIRSIGCSVDWSRDRFTLDEGLNKAVRKVFVALYEKGLIYKGKYIVNWCPRCKTVLSDEEVEHQDERSNLWYFNYPLKEGDGHLTIATTRPETMLGDTAVAVNPSDERYKHLIGKKLILPIVNREIPVIADQYVDKQFGTGAVKVTPAHDPNDYQMGIRHHLEFVEVIDENGIMNENAGEYQGLSIKEARKRVVEEIERLNLLEKIEDYSHSVGHCYRCDTTIDPRLSDQWFVKMGPLAKKAIEVVENDRVKFYPQRWKKVYLNWMYEVHDWCISRQLWWGHAIPVWYCQDCDEIIVSEQDPEKCPKCGSTNLKQDEDVLDTWFSSALWPFSTLGWPEQTPDLQKYYPTSTLVTGFDIIFFWVARMITMGMEFMDEVPFHDVYINQLIRDKKGRKMSKSLGNGIDPIEVVEEYGADAMRFTLAILAGQGRDINLDIKTILNYKHFANKIWNATRFSLMNIDEDIQQHTFDPDALALSDKWILHRLNEAIKSVTKGLEGYDYNLASKSIFEFFWNEFCDWYIESIKPLLYQSESVHKKRNTQAVLLQVLDKSLRLLHPFMPFITEEIWQMLPMKKEKDHLMISKWPEIDEFNDFEDDASRFIDLMEVIRGIRNVRSELQIPPSTKIEIACIFKEKQAFSDEEQIYIKALAGIGEIHMASEKPAKSSTALVSPKIDVYCQLSGTIDLEEEKSRLAKKIKKAKADVKHAEKKLSNEKFLEHADEDVIEETKEKHKEALLTLDRLETLMSDFEG